MGKPRVISPENEQEAVKCAIAGGDPIAYLKNCGAKNPSAAWYHIREKIKDIDPETYAKLQDLREQKKEKNPGTLADAMEGMQDAAEEFFGKCEDMGFDLGKDETPEEPKITQPVVFEDMIVREVEGLFGRYRRSDVGEATYIDLEFTECCDVISNTVGQWRSFMEELDKAAKILGVTL